MRRAEQLFRQAVERKINYTENFTMHTFFIEVSMTKCRS